MFFDHWPILKSYFCELWVSVINYTTHKYSEVLSDNYLFYNIDSLNLNNF